MAVLSVLTILAILAMAFAVLTGIEQTSSAVGFYGMDAQALADAGLEHAKAVLWSDAIYDTTRSDGDNDLWNISFNGRQAQRAPDANVMQSNGARTNGNDAVWIPVHDTRNRLIGRYAVVVQDECAKLNINTACIAPPNLPNEGLSPREGLLGNGKNSGLPFSSAALTRLLAYKYGPNGVPGARDDDNHNNAFLMADGLDNNANGVIDELDEGINEPDEYVPHAPFGDDRAFYSLQEAWRVLAPGTPATASRLAFLRQFATLHSLDNNLRWDDAQRAWVPRQNVNVCGARDVLQTLGQANRKYAFEGNQRMLRRIATATVDYRDENDVLSTAGSEYGVEAVCFSEILANEGSRLMMPYRTREDYYGDRTVYTLPYLYSLFNYYTKPPVDEDDPARREEFPSDKTTAFYIQSANVTPAGVEVQLKSTPLAPSGYADIFRNFSSLLNKRGGGLFSGGRIQWPDNIWRNGELCVYKTQSGLPAKTFKIERSTRDNKIFVPMRELRPEDVNAFTTTVSGQVYAFAQLRGWIYSNRGWYAERPQVDLWSVVPFLQPNLYYRVYVQETNIEIPIDSSYKQNLCTRLDVDGQLARGSEQEMGRLRYRYKDGEAVRADNAGCIDVYLTSAKQCSPRRRNRISGYYCARPDIIELVNIGDRPISLRGWSLVANTGSISYELGMITRATSYLRDEHGRGQDENPVIRPNEYFYLCNNMEIFDYDYGSRRDGVWGSAADEQMPVYEISDDTWGVRYQIKRVNEYKIGTQNMTDIICDNEMWIKDQFKYEIAEFQSTRKNQAGMATSPDGVRSEITGNTRNTLNFENLALSSVSFVRPGDSVMIVGLPRVGGLVSTTLKNEYGQIAARVIQYGNPQRDAGKEPRTWLNQSVEKTNPTREDWVQVRTPSFGGTVRKARNRSAVLEVGSHARIKNGPLASVGELRQPRAIAAWLREDLDSRSVATTKLLQGTAEYFDTMGMRLDAEEPGAHLAGWLPAFGAATLSDTRGVVDHTAAWPVNCWSNQSLTIMSGKNRGETFAIEGNSRNRLQVVGRSVPSRVSFFVRSGDQYSLGPGYASSLYYTHIAQDDGEWEWKDKRIPPGRYQLYLVGLNDAIRTTEFLEENFNAKMDVYLYNYTTSAYDLVGRNKQYDKSDTVYAGEVLPQHLSSSGGLRIKVAPKGLGAQHGSGLAWLDHVFVTPVPVAGRININTASARVLMTLGGMEQSIANNIVRGADAAGQPRLKPYRNAGDLLMVRGMTPDLFSKIINLVTVRSQQFTVYVAAQRIRDTNNDGQFSTDAGDRVEAEVRLRALLDRGGVMATGGGAPLFQVFDRERL
ncbi:MAG: helix-hairpin-helix domain-containing protein [bacterium]|nr:helix-hairpin-helix domain-containing protein [bacterium]